MAFLHDPLMELAVEEFEPIYMADWELNDDMAGRWHRATWHLQVPAVSAAGPPLPWWTHAHDSPPNKPVFAGIDLNGGHLYVGRSWHEGQLLPAKVAPSYHCTFVAYNGRENHKYQSQFEVLHLLRGRAEWIEASDGVIPAHAFPIGITASGRTTFSVRASVKGIVTPGWIAQGNSQCNVSYDGKEWSFRNYEVLAIL